MTLKDSIITILNYNQFTVCIPTQTRTYTLDPCTSNSPTMIKIPFTDCEYVNGQSNAFRNGLLFPQLENPKEFYEALRIYDWENILTNEKIEDLLINPTIEGLQIILNIREDSLFERVRMVLVGLKTSNNFNLSTKVVELVEKRHDELKHNIFTTQYVLQASHIKNDAVIESESTKQLKQQNENLQKQMKDMQEMMAKMLEMQNKSNETVNDIESDCETPVVKKSAGRPKTK